MLPVFFSAEHQDSAAAIVEGVFSEWQSNDWLNIRSVQSGYFEYRTLIQHCQLCVGIEIRMLRGSCVSYSWLRAAAIVLNLRCVPRVPPSSMPGASHVDVLLLLLSLYAGVDFDSMTQTNLRTHTCRKIRRVVIE